MTSDLIGLADLEHLYALSPEGQRLLFTEAHTTYRFTDEPVDEDRLRAIWELLKWAPTASNVSPLRVLFIRSAEAKQRLLPLLTPPNKPKSESAAVVAVLAADNDFAEYVPRLWPAIPQMKELLEANPGIRDENATFNATLQSAYFLLAVRATGLAAGPMKGFDAKGVDAEFFPDGRWRSVLVVNIGWAAEDGTTERMPRLEYEEAVRFV